MIIRVPFRVKDGQVCWRYDQGLPQLPEGTTGHLHLELSEIKDEKWRHAFERLDYIPMLCKGTVVALGLQISMMNIGRWEHLVKALDQYPEPLPGGGTSCVYVPLTLQEVLHLKMRSGKRGHLTPVRCRIEPLLPEFPAEASSLNHAYTLLSEVLETRRKSHTANVFERARYRNDQGEWHPLGELRDFHEFQFLVSPPKNSGLQIIDGADAQGGETTGAIAPVGITALGLIADDIVRGVACEERQTCEEEPKVNQPRLGPDKVQSCGLPIRMLVFAVRLFDQLDPVGVGPNVRDAAILAAWYWRGTGLPGRSRAKSRVFSDIAKGRARALCLYGSIGQIESILAVATRATDVGHVHRFDLPDLRGLAAKGQEHSMAPSLKGLIPLDDLERPQGSVLSAHIGVEVLDDITSVVSKLHTGVGTIRLQISPDWNCKGNLEHLPRLAAQEK